jgi:opacity protein-like surface antigen
MRSWSATLPPSGPDAPNKRRPTVDNPTLRRQAEGAFFDPFLEDPVLNRLPLIALSLLAAGSASAQDADWSYKATLYGWLPGLTTTLDTRFGTVESETSASDALSNLDMAFMGSLAAQNGRWGVVGDLLYTDLSASQDTPFALYGEGSVGVKMTAFSGYALYRVSTDPNVLFDIGAGFRAFDVDIDVSLSPGILPGASQSIDGSWAEPLIAARLAVPLNEDWFLMGFADWGGTGSGDETWQVYAGVGYAFADNWSTQFGYRYMDISRELDGRDVSLGMSGLVLALSYEF